MNALTFADLGEKLAHHARLALRHLDPVRRTTSFSSGVAGKISRIYVINLDRKPKRWARIRRELSRFRGADGGPLMAMTRRFSAIDARHLELPAPESDLTPSFTLAEQLAVHPNPLLDIDEATQAHEISMSVPEIAVTLSHIEVWKLVASGDAENVLVLEDDVVMRPGFARRLDREWSVLNAGPGLELLYLAYRDVNPDGRRSRHGPQRRERPGLWEASGYVLSRDGARELLSALPVRGPVDLWLNFQFEKLRTYTTSRPVIEQRIAEPSTNAYSVLPVLSQVGAITREKPLVPASRRLPGPVIVVGREEEGMTSMATALSMLGYSVLHDLDQLPPSEARRLKSHGTGIAFNAFSNIGSVDAGFASQVATRNRRAIFILVGNSPAPNGVASERMLRIDATTTDKWSSISDFLGLDYPAFAYPREQELGLRRLAEDDKPTRGEASHRDLEWDRSPWVLRHPAGSRGVTLRRAPSAMRPRTDAWTEDGDLPAEFWSPREDTFPSNLALFRSANVTRQESVELVLRSENSRVRDYTAGAVASRESFLYGSFAARLKPARGSGIITGFFLHRNGPRQEIDIEFRGKDTTKMLVNVFFNPGPEGTRLEYGYRGTPTEIDLGFDAADEFHDYEIEWTPSGIRWLVDDRVVYERNVWDPTPIPDRPLELNINVWTSRSKEFAGRLDHASLPATTAIARAAVSVYDEESSRSSVHADRGSRVG